MKKRFFYVLFGAAIVSAAAWNVGQSLNKSKHKMALNDVALANVEALAYELPEVTVTCGISCRQCWKLRDYFGNGFSLCERTEDPSNYCPFC